MDETAASMLQALVPLSGPLRNFQPASHIVISVLRNESLRIPYFLTYYRAIGFDHFLLIDNGSTDGTRELLLRQPDVTLFQTVDSFGRSGFGMQWVNLLLDQFCHNRWILLADADELLVWPGSECETIQSFTARLDSLGAQGLFTLLLDMYSDKAFGSVGYVQGAPFLDATPFFDRGPYELMEAVFFPNRQIYGGVRARVIREVKQVPFHPPTVSKLPLLRWQRGQKFCMVAHGLIAPVMLAPMRGALLHFKMFDDLPAKCQLEVARGEHFAGGLEYRALGKAIERSPNQSFFNQNFSVHYADTKQLVSLGLMSNCHPFAV